MNNEYFLCGFGHWSFFPCRLMWESWFFVSTLKNWFVCQCRKHAAEMTERVEILCCMVLRAEVELLSAECRSCLLSFSFVGTQRWSLVSLSSAIKLPPPGKLGPPSLGWFTRWGPYSSFGKVASLTQYQVVRVVGVWESGVQCTALLNCPRK